MKGLCQSWLVGKDSLKEGLGKTSLVILWLRIHLPMQGTRVQSLSWEDLTYHGASKPVYVPQLLSQCSRARTPQLEEPPQ